VRPFEILSVASAGEPTAVDNRQLGAGCENLRCLQVGGSGSCRDDLGLDHLLRGKETEPQI